MMRSSFQASSRQNHASITNFSHGCYEKHRNMPLASFMHGEMLGTACEQ